MARHHRLEDPLVPGLPPKATRLLAVGGDTARLGRLVTNLSLRGYQVTGSTDPAAAMAGLRQDGQQGFNFDLVMVDNDSEYPGRAHAALNKLFEFAIREPRLCAYAIKGDRTFGPLEIKDIQKYMKPIYTGESNGANSTMGSLNCLYNASPSTTASTITNFSLSGRRPETRSRKRTRDTDDSQEVEQDPKKPRVIWAGELNKKFLEAYDKLEAAGEKPVPTKILHLMDEPTLTRENIASHLQKHRANLRNKGRTESPRRSPSRTRRDHRSAPQASFPSPNMPSQQQAPPTVMQPDLSATVYINYGTNNAHATLEASTTSDLQELVIRMQTFTATDNSNESMPVDDAPSKDMHPGTDDPKQNSCVGISDGNSLPKDFSEILDDEPNPSWDTEFLFSSND